jgi:excisionase family DNA binding protein
MTPPSATRLWPLDRDALDSAIAQGATPASIAAACGVTPRTVRRAINRRTPASRRVRPAAPATPAPAAPPIVVIDSQPAPVPRKDAPAVRAQIEPANRLLTPAEVAVMLRVDPKTVTRWARAGKLNSIRTPGGHRRYSESEVRSFLNGWELSGAALQSHS